MEFVRSAPAPADDGCQPGKIKQGSGPVLLLYFCYPTDTQADILSSPKSSNVYAINLRNLNSEYNGKFFISDQYFNMYIDTPCLSTPVKCNESLYLVSQEYSFRVPFMRFQKPLKFNFTSFNSKL